MRTYRVRVTGRAIADIERIRSHIATDSSLRETAQRYALRLLDRCDALSIAPHRGARRDDLVDGLRILAISRNAVAAFIVDDEAGTVRVLRIFHGRQDYEALILKGGLF